VVLLQSFIIVSSSSVLVAAVTVNVPFRHSLHTVLAAPNTASPRINLSERETDCLRQSATQVKSAFSHVAFLRTSSQLGTELIFASLSLSSVN